MKLTNPIGANSVTTDMLQNGAVTEAKTDFDTTPLSVAGGGTGSSTGQLQCYNPSGNAELLVKTGHVGGEASITITTVLASSRPGLRISVGNTGRWFLGSWDETQHFQLFSILAGKFMLYVDDAGYVGIMNTSPAHALDVSGDGNFTTNLTVGATLTAHDLVLTNPLPVADGGTGTSAPAIVAGNGISVSGSFPNQTVQINSTVTNHGTTGHQLGLTSTTNTSYNIEVGGGQLTKVSGYLEVTSAATAGTITVTAYYNSRGGTAMSLTMATIDATQAVKGYSFSETIYPESGINYGVKLSFSGMSGSITYDLHYTGERLG